MPVSVECEGCGSRFRMPDQYAGRVVPCKRCGSDIDAPDSLNGRSASGRGGGARRKPGGQARSGPAPVIGYLIAFAGIPFFVLAAMANAAPVVVMGILASFFCVGTTLAAAWKGYHVVAGILLGLISPLGLIVLALMEDRRGTRAAVHPDGLSVPVLGGAAAAVVAPFCLWFLVASIGSLFHGARRPARTGVAQDNDTNGANQPAAGGGVPRPANMNVDEIADRARQGQAAKPVVAAEAPDVFEWKVEVDAPAAWEPYPDDYELSMPLPPFTPARYIQFPRGISPYVAVGQVSDDKHGLIVGNVRTRAVVGKVAGIKYFSPAVLDPSGRYVAMADTTTKGVLVWDVPAGEAAGLLPMDTTNNKYVDFAGPARVLALGGGFGAPLNVWKLPSGEAEHSLGITKHLEVKSIAVSPGGRYLAFQEVIYNPGIRVYDLDSGTLAGSLRTDFDAPSARFTMLAFSPDGQELAGLFYAGSSEYLVCWDVASGERVFEHQFDERMRTTLGSGHPEPLQWFPNRKQWLLYGQELFDRGAKRIVYSFPDDLNQRLVRKVLSDRYLAVLDGEISKPLLVALKYDGSLISDRETGE